MKARLSAHGAYHHKYHIVWIPKYRKRVLEGGLKTFIEKHLFDISVHYPDVEIEQYSIQKDHIHLVVIIPPRYSVSGIVGKIKANTSRLVRKKFKFLKEIYWRNEFWSPGFFSSTVGIDEAVIKKYIEYQEKADKGQIQLTFEFK